MPMPSEFDSDLEERLTALEAKDSPEAVSDRLPAKDFWISVVVLTVVSVLLLVWGYSA